MQLILGSQSPRRKEILNFFTLPFEQISPVFDEDSIPFEGDPCAYVSLLSKGKGDSLQVQFPDALILTADTIVYKEGKIFGKPAHAEEAFNHLKALSGQWHSVFTSLTLHHGEKEFQQVEETRVLFKTLTDQQIEVYQHTLPCTDKAGGYMIQAAGSLIVKRIEGCYYNVMGLPINALDTLLQQVGINLWTYLKG